MNFLNLDQECARRVKPLRKRGKAVDPKEYRMTRLAFPWLTG
jgi:hypothetical protein